ncbi:MAG: DUF2490 domain-containing protein [Planctomycetaceae bacterium]|nr:DUF2490 domain-containing protein [Planctomycetaceae bacterium]
MGWRFRQLVRVPHSLATFPRGSLFAWDSAFSRLSDTDWGAQAGFDQSRTFAGFGFTRDPDANGGIKFGYLNETIDVRAGMLEPTASRRSNSISEVGPDRGCGN